MEAANEPPGNRSFCRKQIRRKNFLEPVLPHHGKVKGKVAQWQTTWQIDGRFTATGKSEIDVPENLPEVLGTMKLTGRYRAYCDLHFPPDAGAYEAAVKD